MGVCCTKEQTQINELINSFPNSNDDIIQDTKLDSLSINELRLETVKSIKTSEEKELDLIIHNIQSIFEEKTKKISQIELYNLAIYYKDNYTQSNYYIYDTRKSIEQKEDYLKKMNHINYTYNQIKNIKNEKLEKFKNFLNNKKIIFIISEKYLNKENRIGKATPFDIVNSLFNINSNLTIYLLNNILNENETPKLFLNLISFLNDKSSLNLPFILFSYRHVTTFFKEGYVFINFSDDIIFSFESLIDELNSDKKILNFENNFLNEMNINYIINIDNDSKNKYKIKEYKNKNKIYKNINVSKLSILENKNDFLKLCESIRNEIINKGYSIYINIENYDEENNEWVYVIIIFMTYIIQVNYLEIANYLRQKINFIKNISQIINNCLNNEDFDEIFNI
jgi:hypothetical protein